MGYTHIRYEYDDCGNKIWERYFNLEDDGLTGDELAAVGTTGNELTLTAIGADEIDFEFFKERERPAECSEGYASCEYKYMDGKRMEERYYDAGGNLVRRGDTGCAVIKYQYDEYGRQICQYYFDEHEEPVIHSIYYREGAEFLYDERGNRTDVRYLDADGELREREDFGASRQYFIYDKYDRLIGEQYYIRDEAESEWKLVSRNDTGYAVVWYSYERGKLVRKEYLDADENPVVYEEEGYAAVEYEYDENGQRISEVRYDENGQIIEEVDIII